MQMKKWLKAVLICLLVTGFCTAALAEWNLLDARMPGFWEQYTTDELLALKELLDAELESRTYVEESYVLNTNTMKFHVPYCSSVQKMKEKNRKDYTENRSDLLSVGYSPCGNCHP